MLKAAEQIIPVIGNPSEFNTIDTFSKVLNLLLFMAELYSNDKENTAVNNTLAVLFMNS